MSVLRTPRRSAMSAPCSTSPYNSSMPSPVSSRPETKPSSRPVPHSGRAQRQRLKPGQCRYFGLPLRDDPLLDLGRYVSWSDRR